MTDFPNFDEMSIEELVEYTEKYLGDPEVRPFDIDGVTFEVVAKVRAIKDDGSTIDTLAGPIQLIKTPSLYRALFTMTSACDVAEFQLDDETISGMASRTIATIAGGGLKWSKPKENK